MPAPAFWLGVRVPSAVVGPYSNHADVPRPCGLIEPLSRADETVTPSTPPVVRPTTSPSPSFGEAFAVSCAGHPTADQVIAVLRRSGSFLPAGATVTVRTMPQCAGEWQYTVISIPQHDPLQVVTKGPPSALQLVTAGTDVCNIPVRTQAPQGIRSLARCA